MTVVVLLLSLFVAAMGAGPLDASFGERSRGNAPRWFRTLRSNRYPTCFGRRTTPGRGNRARADDFPRSRRVYSACRNNHAVDWLEMASADDRLVVIGRDNGVADLGSSRFGLGRLRDYAMQKETGRRTEA